MDEKEFLQMLAKAVSPLVSGSKAVGTPSETAYLYEETGLFGVCDGPMSLINAMVGPIGIEGQIPWVGNFTEKEFVDALTQFEESGTEQATACGDCITTRTKACAQFYCFGRFCRQTEELQFDRIGIKANANVPTKTLFGAISGPAGEVLVPMGARIEDAFYLQSRAVGYALRFKNSQLLWTGNPANNNATNSYAEYLGLQMIVNTGKFDAYTQLLCTALDSFLMNFGFNNPTSAGTYAIQHWMRRMVLQFMTRAGGAGMDWSTARMIIAMTNNQWDHIARAFACDGLDLCSTGDAADREITQSADQARSRYEEYLGRMQLPIYGRWYDVVLDTQIPETTGQANGICSDIYFLTTDINGEPILYGEYQDFNQTYGRVRQELVSMFGSDDIAITDNGRYALIRDNERGCFDLQAYTKPRLVALAPWLLGRIQNVCAQVQTEPLPAPTLSGSVYTKGCGRYTTPVPTLYGGCIT
jgi:hypothetical protein